MERINTFLEEAIFNLSNDFVSHTDWELVYYDYYIALGDIDEAKYNLGKLLVEANVITNSSEQLDKINILKSVIKDYLGKSKILK